METMKKIINIICEKIQSCNKWCFCKGLIKKEGLLTSQKKCGNCHSKEILIELLNEVKDI